MRQWMAAVLVALGLSACVGPMAPIRDAENSEAGLVYGYIDGTLGVPNVTMYNTANKVLAPWLPGHVPAHTYSSGLVVFDNVAPGDYIIHGFGVGQTAYSLGEQRILIHVRPGEIKYLGAFWYAHEPGLFSSEFTMTAVDEPTPATVLQWAIEVTDGTDWAQRLRVQAAKK